MEYSPPDNWDLLSLLGSVIESPSISSMSEITENNNDSMTGVYADGVLQDACNVDQNINYMEASYNNVLSDQAIQSIKQQQNQNKLIHLDPIPDFKEKDEIKPWLQKIFYPQGIEIVIERSDKIKVVFKCKASKRSKGTDSSSHAGASASSTAQMSPAAQEEHQDSSENAIQRRKKKRAVSPFNTCPFRVRAAYSLKRKKWSIVVVNNGHSHVLKFNPDSDEYKRFKNKLREDKDWDAIKKFDELEYRSKFNLPTEPTPIPCDCGMTQEIESFSVVLPNNNILSAPTSIDVDRKIASMIHRRMGRKVTQRRSGLHCGIIKSKLNKETQLTESNTDTDIDIKGSSRSANSLKEAGSQEFSMADYLFQDSTEIDFTEVFLKPLSQLKQQQSVPTKDSQENAFSDNDMMTHDMSRSSNQMEGSSSPKSVYLGGSENWNMLEKILHEKPSSAISSSSVVPQHTKPHNQAMSRTSADSMQVDSSALLFDLSDISTPTTGASTMDPTYSLATTGDSSSAKFIRPVGAFSLNSQCPAAASASGTKASFNTLSQDPLTGYMGRDFNSTVTKSDVFEKVDESKHTSTETLENESHSNPDGYIWDDKVDFV
ncbi:HER082Wp [Eremothecium sinecaudum]|uniref:HER082Wp n=1 Tax=Eremothecium sinecaudum TaxID=45286 RepID=A0A120K2F2_9SACH|nr:HER082Wp [Eremothecium sinecaudum]AMD21361.1 HER082Wp [Eremothecium sinecaudum]